MMRRWLATLAALALARMAVAAPITFLDNGPSRNRVNVVFLGDGYRASEMGTFQQHIDRAVSHLLTEQPFSRYRSYFNAHRIELVSAQSGADDPTAGRYVNTALDATYLYDGRTQRYLGINQAAALDIMRAEIGGAFRAGMKLAPVNASQYGGGGGHFAVYAGGHSATPEIALHELGHSFARLADEYGGTVTYTGPEPSSPNLTIDPTGAAKWERWLGYTDPATGTVGAYEGAARYGQGLYRPSQTSKMRSLGQPFDPVGREAFLLRMYALVDPMDAWRDNSMWLRDPAQLWVDLIDATVLDVQWYDKGQPIAGATGEAFDPRVLGHGLHLVSARAYDPTDWVRSERSSLEQWVTWRVLIAPEPGTAMLVSFGLAWLGVQRSGQVCPRLP